MDGALCVCNEVIGQENVTSLIIVGSVEAHTINRFVQQITQGIKTSRKQNPADQKVEGATAKSETSLNKPEQVISTTANTDIGSGVQPKSYYRQQLSMLLTQRIPEV
jgi:hypothetical protein